MELKEEWKNIKNYPNYQVSNLGRVKRLSGKDYSGHNRKEKIRKNIETNIGYLRVGLCKNGKRKYFLIHRLVAEAFIPNPNNFPQVNHINEIKTDNRAENLEWCTQEYNNSYGTGHIRAHLNKRKKVNQYDMKKNLIKTWNGIIEITKELNVSDSAIIMCCKGERKQIKGYIWRYVDDN